MIGYVWPILLVIGANCLYNISTKAVPAGVDSFAALCVTYALAALLSLGAFVFTCPGKSVLAELAKCNWTSVLLSIAIVALEFGYINVYRAGWKISIGSLVANIGLACVLLLLGVVVYKETITIRQLAGMLICIVGLVLISK